MQKTIQPRGQLDLLNIFWISSPVLVQLINVQQTRRCSTRCVLMSNLCSWSKWAFTWSLLIVQRSTNFRLATLMVNSLIARTFRHNFMLLYATLTKIYIFIFLHFYILFQKTALRQLVALPVLQRNVTSVNDMIHLMIWFMWCDRGSWPLSAFIWSRLSVDSTYAHYPVDFIHTEQSGSGGAIAQHIAQHCTTQHIAQHNS